LSMRDEMPLSVCFCLATKQCPIRSRLSSFYHHLIQDVL